MRKTIGSYQVERELGKGGMGVVYVARQPDLDRRVVVKGLRRDFVDDPIASERFIREAQAASAIHHQNVVTVHDCFMVRGERFIALEFVDGVDLATALGQIGRFPSRMAALVALEICRGLEEIHAQGIVHRDLKPSNVLLGRAGEVKIADFGIAIDGSAPALTQTGHAVGTPSYMSPEQLRGARADARSDIFSLGIVLYEMLAGRTPFEVNGERGLLDTIEAGHHRPVSQTAPATPRAMKKLIRRCLQPKAARRPEDASELRRTLDRQLGAPAPAETRARIAGWLWERGVFEIELDEEATSDATRALVRPEPPQPRRSSPLPWAAAMLLVTAALGAAASTSWVRVTALLQEMAGLP
ncbi:MAG: serine/threonine-protein kinase [Myxococcota bacterium]